MDCDTFPPEIQQALISSLSSCLTDRRLATLYSTLNNRTRYLTVLLEDIFQTQNASAALRSCECFGIQDVHIVENRNEFGVNPRVVMGSTKWLTIHRYNSLKFNTSFAINSLKEQGYRIVATSPHTIDTTINHFDVCKGKFALLIGTELTGLSTEALQLADEYVQIPMLGFTESLNLSVTVGVSLHHLSNRLRETKCDFSLAPNEQQVLLHEWLRKSVRSWKSIEKRVLQELGENKI
jgi:tRNA (guanosine-2'-O-)-methyltransferase